jgi:hypothetical protein
MEAVQGVDELPPFEVVMAYVPGTDTSGPQITPTLTTVAFVLWPRSWYAGSDEAVVIPAGTNIVTFDIRLARHEFARYAIAVRDLVTNAIVSETNRVTIKVTAGHASVLAVIPTDRLRPRHYVVDLTGYNAKGTLELISRCPFELLAR